MYQNFEIISDSTADNAKLMGYHWEVKTPKRVMCIIHGIGEYAGRYDRMAEFLTDKGIAVVSMDLRGHGLSEGKRGHTAPRIAILDDISLMIEKAKDLYPNTPVVLYGHSMGGNICLDYRCRGSENDFPVKYIVTGPWLKLVANIPAPIVTILKGVAKLLPTVTMSSGCEAKDLGNIEITKGYDEDPLVHPSISLATASDCMNVADALLAGTHTDDERAKGKPFLLMHGDADKICSVEGSRMFAERHRDEPNFTYIEWEGYYHEIHNGGPNATGEKVIETITDFVLA